MDDAQVFTELRQLLFFDRVSDAGSVADAEDVVQESDVQFQRAQDAGTDIESAKAYLATTTPALPSTSFARPAHGASVTSVRGCPNR